MTTSAAETQAISNQAVADGLNALQAGRVCPPEAQSHDLGLLSPENADSWTKRGFFILRGLVPADECAAMSTAVIDMFSRAETDGQSFGGHHLGAREPECGHHRGR